MNFFIMITFYFGKFSCDNELAIKPVNSHLIKSRKFILFTNQYECKNKTCVYVF